MLCVILLLMLPAKAQKKGIIESGIPEEKFVVHKVRIGKEGLNKVWNFSFGEFNVITSKKPLLTFTSSKTKSANKTIKKSSFVVLNKSSDTVHVNTVYKIDLQNLKEIVVLPFECIDSIEHLKGSNLLTASISINRDTANVWALILSENSYQQTGDHLIGCLTNRERKIIIQPTTFQIKGKNKRSKPAFGYVFAENERQLSALQYHVSGAFPKNERIVTFNNAIDDGLKLILAAASVAILEEKYYYFHPYIPDF